MQCRLLPLIEIAKILLHSWNRQAARRPVPPVEAGQHLASEALEFARLRWYSRLPLKTHERHCPSEAQEGSYGKL